MQMIADHYLGEAQLLTTGAESNLLKLAELRGNMTVEQSERWVQIKKDFLRNKAIGGADADVGSRVVVQLADMVEGIKALGASAIQVKEQVLATEKSPTDTGEWVQQLTPLLNQLTQSLAASQPKVEVINQPVPGIDKILRVLAETIEKSIFPLVRSMDKKLDIDLRTHESMQEVLLQLRQLEKDIGSSQKTEKKSLEVNSIEAKTKKPSDS
jgi:hemerythrin superfamily protein